MNKHFVENPVIVWVEERSVNEGPDDFVVDEHTYIKAARLTASFFIVFFITDDQPLLNHGLVIEVDLTEVVPVRVSVQANVGNDVCMIIGVIGFNFMHNAHHAADKLDIRGQASKWPENGGDAQRRMVKSFAQHLHLYDAIKLAASKSGNNVILLLFVHFAVNLMRLNLALLEECAHLTGMINRTGDCNHLV